MVFLSKIELLFLLSLSSLDDQQHLSDTEALCCLSDHKVTVLRGVFLSTQNLGVVAALAYRCGFTVLR